jgi:hypothetical protein
MGIGSSKCQKDLKLEQDAIKSFLHDEEEIKQFVNNMRFNSKHMDDLHTEYRTFNENYHNTKRYISPVRDAPVTGGRTRRRRK